MPTADLSSALGSQQSSLASHLDNHAVPQLRSPRIWGTFSASGGVGATTISLHLARLASQNGLRTLVIESDITAPLREILGANPPYWEEFQLDISPSMTHARDAMPRECAAGFALLTRKGNSEISQNSVNNFMLAAGEHFDFILIDNPFFAVPQMQSFLVVENSLPSLIGLKTLAKLYKPEIVLINKFSARIKKSPSIASFVVDAKVFQLPKTPDVQLALGLGIQRKLTRRNEKVLNNILAEMVN